MEKFNLTERIVDADYKDSSPVETVNKIKGILKHYGIETVERWHETNVPYCYSLSVIEKSAGFSVNGKGLTKEFALASGYGELMERLQLGFVGLKAVQKDGAYAIDDVQHVKIPAKTLFEKNSDWYKKISARLLDWNGSVIAPEEIVNQYAGADGNVNATPFVNLMSGETVYLPSEMRKSLYTSNGCAAGNSIEEAVVQALSEAVERYYKLQIISQKICTPEVPEETLKQYKIAYNIIQFIRAQGYRVVVKDCSLGTQFPAVCVCYINPKNGRYHTHFGAYPVFEIALERALTETFQGRKIDSFAVYDELMLNADDNAFAANVTKELILGESSRMPEFFAGQRKYAYNEQVGFCGKNNKELLKECLAFFREQGYDVLVRDSSSLGFPTCQVIVPGFSETYIHRVSAKNDENRYLPFAVKTLRNPAQAGIQDIMGTMMHMKEMQNIYGLYKRRMSFLSCTKLMAELTDDEESFLMLASMAHAYYTLGNLPNAEKNVRKMVTFKWKQHEEYLVCLSRYLAMKVNKYSEDLIKNTLAFLHAEQTVEKLYGYINQNKNPLEPFVLHCDMQCDDGCIIKDRCRQKNAVKLIEIVHSAAKKRSFEDFAKTVNDLIAAK